MQRFRSYFLFILGQFSYHESHVELYILTAWFAPSCFIFQQTIWFSFSTTTAFGRFLFPLPTNQLLWKKHETKMKNFSGSALIYQIAPCILKTFSRYVLSPSTLSNQELKKHHCQRRPPPPKKEIESRN